MYLLGQGTILDLQKSWEDGKDSFHVPVTQFPLMSTSYITTVHLLKLRVLMLLLTLLLTPDFRVHQFPPLPPPPE